MYLYFLAIPLLYVIYTLFIKVFLLYFKVAKAYGWEYTYLIYCPLKGLHGYWNTRGKNLHDDAFYYYSEFILSHPNAKAIVYSNLGNLAIQIIDLELIS